MHPVFEWDNHAAAEAHRRWQARHLIGAIVTVMPERPANTEPVRAFVTVKRAHERSYIPIRVAMEDAELRAQVLAGAMREIVAWRQRHRELEELAGIFAQIDWLEEERRERADATRN